MSVNQLRYGLVGCGMMGQEHIKNIHLQKDCVVHSIFEPDADMRDTARELAPNATFKESLKDLVEDEALDCLVIVSPNYLHIPQLKEITSLRTIPILCEKPLSTDVADEAFINELHTSYAAPIWVAMEYRYMPPLTAFLNRCDEVTGGVRMLTIREHRFPFLEKVNDWNRFNQYSGGTLVEKCCHFFDLMRLVLKDEPRHVMASGSQMVNHLNEVYDGQTSDIWDAAYALFDFNKGAKAMLELSMFAEGSKFQEHISAVGPKGKIECFIPGPTRFWPEHMGKQPEPVLVVSPRDPIGEIETPVPVDETILAAGDHHGSTFYQHEGFRRVLLGEQEPDVTLMDGWKAVKMGMAAQQSSLTTSVQSL
ncbi:MAG: Gfo/Idh/MocA family oxidoreductase [Granulosicoccus sp.]|nr:Gfo/Idh/MocA family oxidoreductase [Granulosicoccus sp.]